MFCNSRTVRNAQTAKKVSGATQKKSRFYVAAAVVLLLLLLLSDKLAWAGAHMGWEPINKKCGAFLFFASPTATNPPSANRILLLRRLLMLKLLLSMRAHCCNHYSAVTELNSYVVGVCLWCSIVAIAVAASLGRVSIFSSFRSHYSVQQS